MKDRYKALELFHPLIQKWFRERLGAPTDIQAKAWPEIAGGSHVLATAPTGSGKTLTAFLWAINQLIAGACPLGQTRVLYVSPLKALNNDIRRNLASPLAELAEYFTKAGEIFPRIDVLTRSGDTPAEERRQMLRHPPEILITTPESLNIIISSRSGSRLLAGIATVILDEIHAVVGGKRGTHLITAVERLVRLAGEFQRIALSATARPLETVAEFVGGCVLKGDARSGRYEKRQVRIIRSAEEKRYAIDVRYPQNAREQPVGASRWPVLVEAFKEIIRAHRSTLLFVNSRRTAERVARLINEGEPQELAYAHHGSLSREIRLAVEERLKKGELKAIVATSSLELGIDIGDLDGVILIETPASVSSAIQRIGRSGHSVGALSRGALYPTHGSDFLSAAVMARSATDQQIEPVSPIEAPLDVLAQAIISMVSLERMDVDDLFASIRTSYPYRNLSRKAFDLVLSMLAGRYAETRIRELKARISLDRVDNTVHGREGVQRLIYTSGGTIPDRGYYDLRIEESHAKIGELDEEFVWERSIGDTFSLGTHIWRIKKITPNDVEVVPVEAKPGIFPFWRAEDMGRTFHFSEKILLFLERINDRLDDPSLADELMADYFMDGWAADELIGFLRRQRAATGCDLPHRRHLLIEHFRDAFNTSGTKQVVLHTLWGGRVNRPFAYALQAAWEEKYGNRLETIENNDCLLLMLPDESSAGEIFSLVTTENLERLLRISLEKSAFFGARFRENAGRALLLPRQGFKKRLPLWLNRLRSKKLMESVLPYPDFPILLETWRTCLQDEFDLESLRQLLEEVRIGRIRLTEATTSAASPFADGLIWKQTNTYMYEDDSPLSGKSSRLSGELLKEVLFSASLRPRIPRTLVENLEAKLQRTACGYAPRSADDLLDWTKERLLIPFSVPPDLPDARDVFTDEPIRNKAVGAGEATTADDGRQAGGEADDRGLSDVFLQWLSFYGPVRRSFLTEALGLAAAALDDLLAGLVERETLILDLLTESAEEPEICDRENLEILLRMARRSRRPAFRALSIDRFPLYLAAWQGLIKQGETLDDLQERLDQLFGWPGSADAWEKHILPARMSPYYGAWLDNLMQGSGLMWFGCGRKKLSFAFANDMELFLAPHERTDAEKAGGDDLPDELSGLFPGPVGRYSLPDIVRFSKSDSRSATKKLWDLAWRGLAANDAFAAVRQGILTDFAPIRLKLEGRRPFRPGAGRWRLPQPFPGNWRVLSIEGMEKDPIDEVELVKDRVRQLLRRYGILFREIVAYELPPFRWGAIFRALRIMELSGEILSGYFFEGIPGIQFCSHDAFRFLNEPLPEDPVYWMNAVDPASLAGIGLGALKGVLPSRIPSVHIVYRGEKPVLLSRRNGKVLAFRAPPDDPRIFDYLSFLKVLLSREFDPEKVVTVETVNGKPASESDYARPLKDFGFSIGYKGLELARRYA
jgi:ATP-dependent Lhr-like helicase